MHVRVNVARFVWYAKLPSEPQYTINTNPSANTGKLIKQTMSVTLAPEVCPTSSISKIKVTMKISPVKQEM